jgi:predicted transcriptional regulator
MKIIENNSLMDASVADLMQTPFPEVNANDYIDEISKKRTKNKQAVLVRLPVEGFQIITKYDLIDAI